MTELMGGVAFGIWAVIVSVVVYDLLCGDIA